MYGTETTDAATWQRRGWVIQPYNVPVVLADPPAILTELWEFQRRPFEGGEVDLVEPEAPLDEDELDVEAARKALADSPQRIPYDQVRRELGLA